jgi:hypothetical protein
LQNIAVGLTEGVEKQLCWITKTKATKKLHFPWRENEVPALGRVGAM